MVLFSTGLRRLAGHRVRCPWQRRDAGQTCATREWPRIIGGPGPHHVQGQIRDRAARGWECFEPFGVCEATTPYRHKLV